VIARAYGHAGWSKLLAHLDDRLAWTRDMNPVDQSDGDVDRFLRLACLSYTEPNAADNALRQLAADPALAVRTAATMAACGRADELAALLAADPGAAVREDGPHRWPPVLYLCYSRLGLGDPIGTMRLLLDAGADPNSGFLWRGLPSPFTALTGVLGGGEQAEPPHPKAIELAELLLDAGADPNDNQAFYNRQFRPDDGHLAPLLRHGAVHDHPSPWRDRLGTAYPSPQQMVGEHLRTAARYGYYERIRSLIANGVHPNIRGYHPNLGDQTAYEIAVRHGHTAAAALLAQAGGRSDRLDDADLLLAAALSGDGPEVARLRGRYPTCHPCGPAPCGSRASCTTSPRWTGCSTWATRSTRPGRAAPPRCTRRRCAGTGRCATGYGDTVPTRPCATGVSMPRRPNGPRTPDIWNWPECSPRPSEPDAPVNAVPRSALLQRRR